jgi:hypothetical protein
MDVVAHNEVIRSLEQSTLAFDWVPVALAYDPPRRRPASAPSRNCW